MTLQRGSKGELVTTLQIKLNGSGSGSRITVDGDFGPATEAAVKHYQSLHGYVSNGIADNKLLLELGVIASSPSVISSAISKMTSIKISPKVAIGVVGVIAIAAILYKQSRKA